MAAGETGVKLIRQCWKQWKKVQPHRTGKAPDTFPGSFQKETNMSEQNVWQRRVLSETKSSLLTTQVSLEWLLVSSCEDQGLLKMGRTDSTQLHHGVNPNTYGPICARFYDACSIWTLIPAFPHTQLRLWCWITNLFTVKAANPQTFLYHVSLIKIIWTTSSSGRTSTLTPPKHRTAEGTVTFPSMPCSLSHPTWARWVSPWRRHF